VEHRLYANMKKCEFFRESIGFSYVVSRNGISMEPEKVQAVKDWPAVAVWSKIASFLGLAGYYRTFVHRFSHMPHRCRTIA